MVESVATLTQGQEVCREKQHFPFDCHRAVSCCQRPDKKQEVKLPACGCHHPDCVCSHPACPRGKDSSRDVNRNTVIGVRCNEFMGFGAWQSYLIS